MERTWKKNKQIAQPEEPQLLKGFTQVRLKIWDRIEIKFPVT